MSNFDHVAAVPRAVGSPAVYWWRPNAVLAWMASAFLTALVLAAIVLSVFGNGQRGTEIALQATARWSFLLFWFAYVAGAARKLFGPVFQGLAQRGRELGLAFASSMLVHVGLVLWLLYMAAGQGGTMALFWAGILCTYLLALFSLPRLRNALGPRLWQTLCVAAMEYIAFVFATDFVFLHLQGGGLYYKHPLAYLPFALMLFGGVALRLAALIRQRSMFRKPIDNREL